MKKTRFQTTLSCVSFLGKLILIFLFVFPFLWMLSVSLQTTEETMTFPATIIPHHCMISNYVDAWTSRPFLLFLRNSVIVVAAILVLQLAVMIPAAYSFAKYSFKGKSLLFALVINIPALIVLAVIIALIVLIVKKLRKRRAAKKAAKAAKAAKEADQSAANASGAAVQPAAQTAAPAVTQPAVPAVTQTEEARDLSANDNDAQSVSDSEQK